MRTSKPPYQNMAEIKVDEKVLNYINGWLEQAHLGVRGNIPSYANRTLDDDLAVLAQYQRLFLIRQDSICFANGLH